MKKNIVITLLCSLIIVATVYSQLNNAKTPQTEITKYVHCELWEQFQGNLFGSNTTLTLNYGNNSSYPDQTKESTFVKSQKDVVDALNYMTEKGWEIVSKNVRTLESGVEVCYLFKKKVK